MFRIRRGLSTELFQLIDGKPNYEIPSEEVTLEENCWYLCTDTAELFLGVKVTDPDTNESLITLKRINSDDNQSSEEISPELAEDLAELQGEITTIKNAGYITNTQLEEAISSIEHPTVSFEGYATEEYVDNAIDAIEIPTIPTKVSELENDKNYATEQYVIDTIESHEALATATEVKAKLEEEVIPAVTETILPTVEKVETEILPTVQTLATTKADNILFTTPAIVKNPIGSFVADEDISGLSVAQIFAKLFGIPDHIHTYGDWVRTVAPTCETKGEERRTCTQCDYFETQEVPALGHDEVSHEAKAATCTEIGWNEYVTCTRCDYTTYSELEALGHTEVIDEAVAPTCTTTGLTEGKHCTVCNETFVAQTVVDALGHTEEIVPAVSATCTSTGLTEGKKCSVCHEILVAQTETPILPHTASEAVQENVNSATCTEDGSYDSVVYCSTCGTHEISRTFEVIEKLGHNEVAHEAKAPTCEEAGWDAYETCERCNYTTYTELPATGHSYGEWIEEIPATTESEGILGHYQCSACEKNFDAEYKELSSLVINKLPSEEPEKPEGVIDTIIENKTPMYQLSADGELTALSYDDIITITNEEASLAEQPRPTQSGFYQILDENGDLAESGYQQVEVKIPYVPYMVVLPSTIDVQNQVTIKMYVQLTSEWQITDLALTSDPDKIADICDLEGCLIPEVPQGYTLWVSDKVYSSENVYRFVINEN